MRLGTRLALVLTLFSMAVLAIAKTLAYLGGEALMRNATGLMTPMQAALGLTVLLCAGGSLAISRWMTRPLRRLRTSLARFGAGDISVRLAEDGDEEMASLAREFNTMAAALADSDRRLRSTATALEQGFARRTRELRQHAELLELAGDAIIVCNTDGIILYWNPGAERLYGYPADEALGRAIDDLLHAAQADTAQGADILRSLVAQGSWEGELRQRRRDASTVVCMSRQVLRRDEAGHPDAILIVNIDIGARRRAEAELERFFMLSADLFSISSFEGKFLRVNAAWTQALGYRADELVGRSVFDVIHPQDRPMLEQNRRERLATPGASSLETRLLTKGGEVRWFLWQVVPVPCERVVFGTANDITERRLVEAALRASEERTRLLINTAHDACVVMDSTGKLTEWNPQAELTFGWRRDEAIGKPMHELIVPPAWRERHLEGMRRYLQTGQAVLLDKRIEIDGLHRDGHEFPMEVTLSRIPTAGCTVFSAFLRDISERRRSEIALRDAKEAAEAATRAKSAFLANMSHEIRTPMNSVIGMSELALADQGDPQQRRYLQNILHSAQHLLMLLNDILDLSKVEEGRMELETAPFAVASVIEDVMAHARAAAAAKGLALDAHVHAGLPAWLGGDALRLSQILLNLVTNAVKFTPQGSVRLEAGPAEPHPDGGWTVRFSVSDTGIGMSTAEMERLFRPFQQADSSITRQYGGTGLGLAISLKLAKAMGGNIDVSSQPARGSTFRFHARFDAAAAPAGLLPAPGARNDAGTSYAGMLSGLRFLLVEDNPLNQEIAQAFLERAGAAVDLADNGQHALEILAARAYDCVLMDVQMPVMDGLEATRRIRAAGRHPGLPIIAMTANASNEDRRRCLEAGMDDFIAKPVSRQAFHATIRARLGLKEGAAPGQAADVPGQAALAVLDLGLLSDLVDGDQDEIDRLARQFVENAGATLRDMAFAGVRGDAAALGDLGHRCKSSARAMGAARFALYCEQIEACGRNGDLDGALQRCAQLPAMLKEIAVLVEQGGGRREALHASGHSPLGQAGAARAAAAHQAPYRTP